VFSDSLNGWAIGDSGIIINTTNGGNNWFLQYKKTDHFLTDIFFVNKYLGWGVAWRNNQVNYGSLIYKTTNSGINWSYQGYPDTNIFINCIVFLNSNTGYMGCYGSFNPILKTTNAGINWLPCSIDSSVYANFPVKTIQFFNQNTGLALGGYFDIAGVIWKTTNGGLNWNTKSVGPEPLSCVAFIDSNNFLASGGDYEFGASIVKTSNAGINWQYSTFNEFGIGYNISFRTLNEGYIPLGFARTILKSTNSGANWLVTVSPDSSSIYYINFVDPQHGWGVGDQGAIYKFNSASTSINNITTEIPDEIGLLQNYPNPFNSSTVIKFYLRNESVIKISLYDITGKELMEILNKKLSRGENNVRFTNKNLPSGIYFYKINAINFNIPAKYGKLVIIN
jgi:photosystem II stability/assembly factor-like uncharacterized protein